MRRGDHRVAAARHIAADTANRDVPVAEDDPGQSLDLDILQRGALDLGEITDLRLSKFDIVNGLRRNFGNERLDLSGAQTKARRRPFVEAFRQRAHCSIAALCDIGEDGLHYAADLGVRFFLRTGERSVLDVSRHVSSRTYHGGSENAAKASTAFIGLAKRRDPWLCASVLKTLLPRGPAAVDEQR
jgi:hypothetical protein